TEERVQHLAHHDQLTDLPNRVLFSDRLFQAIAQARRDRGTLALMFLDLDRFKPVNDSLGHDIGDLLLREVALRLQACAPRSSDTVSRLGGDEFVILLAQIDKAMDAVVVAGKVLAALGRPFRIGPHQIEISASIGIAVYPQHGDDVHELLKNADTAMYHAKKAGRNCYRFFREINTEAAV
ncbi:MAG TPA: GGDEF domain-containing protein, partial [Accumulibacter sp.]|nr:GGDEF domain-containing protein [Accumulibacter sp.]